MNTSNGKTVEQLERAVLEAAAVLANEQVAEVRYARCLESAELKLELAREAQGEAEFALSCASLRLESAKHETIVCRRARNQNLSTAPSPEYLALVEARKQLLSLPVFTDAESVLETARDYGVKTAAFWACHSVQSKLDDNLKAAREAERLATEAHAEAVRNLRPFSAAVAEAEQELREVWASGPKVLASFGAQSALTDAVAELTGTGSQQVAMSFFYTKDLNIVLPEDVGR